jgi:5'(3')-deoxyribonucleotidase
VTDVPSGLTPPEENKKMQHLQRMDDRKLHSVTNKRRGHKKKAMTRPFIEYSSALICLNKSCIKAQIDENMSNAFPFRNDIKHGEVLYRLSFSTLL